MRGLHFVPAFRGLRLRRHALLHFFHDFFLLDSLLVALGVLAPILLDPPLEFADDCLNMLYVRMAQLLGRGEIGVFGLVLALRALFFLTDIDNLIPQLLVSFFAE